MARSAFQSRPRICASLTAMLVLTDVTVGPCQLPHAARPLCRDAADQQYRRCHELRHARIWAAASRLRLRRAGDASRRAEAPTIIVRRANDGEILKTLDGVERKLTPDMLVIADRPGPVAMAGIMGGAETEVSDTTKRVLLESANFDFVSVRKATHHDGPATPARPATVSHAASIRDAIAATCPGGPDVQQWAAAPSRGERGLLIAQPLPERVVDLPMSGR